MDLEPESDSEKENEGGSRGDPGDPAGHLLSRPRQQMLAPGGGLRGGGWGSGEFSDDLVEALIGHFSPELVGDAGGCPPEVLERVGRNLADSGVLRAELGAFWNLLRDGLARVGYRRPCGGEVRLLNLACGPCVEASVLNAFFGVAGLPGGARNRVRFFGMDLRGAEVEKASRRYSATEEVFRAAGVPVVSEQDPDSGRSVEFFADDATRLVGYREIPGEFDIVFIRHQNVWHDRPAWQKIYAFALGRLAEPGGLLVITSYFDREHMIALELLKALGGEVRVTLANPESRPLDHPGKSADRHLAVIARVSG